jgi:ParB/RepB/Spo0J family partition protein
MKTIQKSDFYKVALAAIIVEKGFNVRTDLGEADGSLDALAQSIAKLGQQTPIIATKVRGEDKFLLTAGHRRLAAIEIANKKYGANITQVNVMSAKGDDQTRVLTMLLDGEASKKLSAAEMAIGFARLKEMGMKPKEIGEQVGVSQAQVYNIIAVTKAPAAIQKMLEEGLISVALVNEIQRTTKDEVEQVQLAQEAIDNANAEVDAPEGEAAPKKKKATSANAKTSKVSADIAKLEAAIELAGITPKSATLQAIVNRLKSTASAEDSAKLLK